MDEKNSCSATTILSHKVKFGHIKDYEEWSKKITAKAMTHDGFQNVTRIQPENPKNPEYVVIVQWSSYENLKKWQQSDDFKQMIKESEDFTISLNTLQEECGMEIWFDWPKSARRLLRPSFFKQTLMAIMIVLPLIFVVGALLQPVMTELGLPYEVKIVINVLIMAPLITLIMPRVTKLLYPWLYPKQKSSRN